MYDCPRTKTLRVYLFHRSQEHQRGRANFKTSQSNDELEWIQTKSKYRHEIFCLQYVHYFSILEGPIVKRYITRSHLSLTRPPANSLIRISGLTVKQGSS